MGRRLLELLDFIRLLRMTDPKHSFEVFVFNILLGSACIAFSILGEHRPYMLSMSLLCFSLGIQYWRVRKVFKRHLQMERAWMERMIPQIEDAMAFCEREMRAKEREPIDPADLALLREDVERARQEAASE